jgi:hypothetical protein
MDQSKALLSALLTAHVIEFIDFRKLAFSSVMRDLTIQAALHAIQHGDSSSIDKILDIFKNTRYALQMASWFSFRTGLDIQETLGRRCRRCLSVAQGRYLLLSGRRLRRDRMAR